jgi:hypothetical protein
MKSYCVHAIMAVFLVASCNTKSHSEDDNTVTILVGKDSSAKAATVVAACRGLIRDGVNPDRILIKTSNSEAGIRLSSEDGVKPGALQKLYGPGKYDGQIVLLRRVGPKVIFTGPSKSICWYVVDESVSIQSVIKTVSSNPDATYMLHDVGHFRENMPNITVPVDPLWDNSK